MKELVMQKKQTKLWEAFWIEAPFAALIFYLIQVISDFFMHKTGVADNNIIIVNVILWCIALTAYSFIILLYSNNTEHKLYTWLARAFVFCQLALFIYIY